MASPLFSGLASGRLGHLNSQCVTDSLPGGLQELLPPAILRWWGVGVAERRGGLSLD